MCGVAGILRREGEVPLEDITALTTALVHRGPDGTGVFNKGNYAIGHRRLSIIDLSMGAQPMHTEDGKYHITYNGELYNYRELRNKLMAEGVSFTTSSDTEVVLKAYVHWGRACLEHFRGMFAFAIADDMQRSFFVARDFLGIKPLVIYRDKNQIAFASELGALKKLQGFDKSIDVQAIDQYLNFQYIPAPRTIYTHVTKLKPAHYVIIGYDFSISEQIPYYEFSFLRNDSSDKSLLSDAYETQLDSILLDSVEKHTIADVDYGAFLSGGIDSTLVVDYMSRILDKPVKTFSIGFVGDDNSELEYARLASKINNTEHHEKILSGDAIKIIPELVSHYGEPFGDSSAVPTYYVSKLASEHVKMVLSGDGADEQFTGYHSYMNLARKIVNPNIRGKLNNIIKYRLLNKDKSLDEFYKVLYAVTYYPLKARKKLWRDEYNIEYDNNIKHYMEHYEKCSNDDVIRRAQYLDMKEYLPGAILTKVDIASMMSSLEVRTPFIDKKVWEYALTIPLVENFRYIPEKGFQGKMLLKKLMADKYPPEFLYRKKRGFSMPLHLWFADSQNYAYKKKMSLLGHDAKINLYFKPDFVKKIVQSNSPGNIWLLLILEEWLQQNT